MRKPPGVGLFRPPQFGSGKLKLLHEIGGQKVLSTR
jgi:hypothetical protein